MKAKLLVWLSVTCIWLIAACVPTQQFRELEGKKILLNDERDELFAENEKLNVDNLEMKARISTIETDLDGIKKEQDAVSEEFNQLQNVYDDLKRRHDDLQQSQEALLTGHTRETKRLLTQLQKTQEDLTIKEDRLRELEDNASQKMVDLEKLRAQLEERNQRLVELERILNEKDAQMNGLKDAITSALYGFEKEGLSVYIKNGMVYVSMEEKLLFQTGSIEVDPRGVQALRTLAGVLENKDDILITIEGHTDDVPVRSNASFNDNWDLSVKRATSIVRILLGNSSIDPTRLIASGRGEFLPVDPAESVEARQKNRRTEIILTPRLDELYRLLESNSSL
jgi:chemotaxis protein MotB